MSIYTFRVLFDGDDTGNIANLPLATIDEVEDYGAGGANQEWCGIGSEGDFNQSDENGKSGEVWEFVTTKPDAMESALNNNPAVLVYRRRDGGLEG